MRWDSPENKWNRFELQAELRGLVKARHKSSSFNKFASRFDSSQTGLLVPVGAWMMQEDHSDGG